MTDAAPDPILDLCTNGHFGDLRLGSPWPEVVASVGRPTDVSAERKFDGADLVKGIALYEPDRGRANLQLFVERRAVTGIWLYVYGEPDLGPLCCLVGEIGTKLSGAAGVDGWTAAFDAAGVRWRIDPTFTFDDQVALLTQSGACCVWERVETARTETLNKIGLSASFP